MLWLFFELKKRFFLSFSKEKPQSYSIPPTYLYTCKNYSFQKPVQKPRLELVLKPKLNRVHYMLLILRAFNLRHDCDR